MLSLSQPALLAEFVKTTAPKALAQFEYLFKTNKSEAGYLVYDQVRSSVPLSLPRASSPPRRRALAAVFPPSSTDSPPTPSPSTRPHQERAADPLPPAAPPLVSQPSFAEFHLLYLVHALRKLVPSVLDAYPTLAAWDKTMRARPGLANYEPKHEMLNGNRNGQEALAL